MCVLLITTRRNRIIVIRVYEEKTRAGSVLPQYVYLTMFRKWEVP